LAATLIHAGAYLAILSLTKLSPSLSNVMAYFIALGASLFGHSRFTFGMRLDPPKLAKFLMVSLAGLGINALFVVLIGLLERPPQYAALLFLVTPMLTYILFKTWVYRA
jgi:putative flippase GtrA